MTRAVARLLISLYPLHWRARYAQEFEAFLTQENAGFRDIGDVVSCALRERIFLLGEFMMTNLQRSLVLMAYSCLAAILAGINLWWTVDDTPLARAMQQHALLSVSWGAVEAGSLIMSIAALAAGLPVLFAIVQFAFAHQRRDVLVRLALPPCIAAALLIWTTLTGMLVHWWPTPWDIAGDWAAPSSWPPLPLRRELSAITTLLLLATVLGTAISVKGAIRRSPLSEMESALPWRTVPTRLSRITRVAAFALAASMALMLAGVITWGLFSDQYDSGMFHSRAGGFFGVPLFISWAGSVGLFLIGAVTAFRGVGLSLRPTDAATGT
jgi:hypothetical protein